MSNRLPIEILALIFQNLQKSDLKSCLLISRKWNHVALGYFEQDIHVFIQDNNIEKFVQDLTHCPSFGLNISKIQFMLTFSKTHLLTLVKSAIEICSNLHYIGFIGFHDIKLIKMLYDANFHLPKIKQFSLGNYASIDIIQYYLLLNNRYNNTIEQLKVIIKDHTISNFTDLLSYVSGFGALNNLQICWSQTTSHIKDNGIDLNKLLAVNKNLESLSLVDIDMRESYTINDIDKSAYPNLKTLSIMGRSIDVTVLQYIIPQLNNLESLHIYVGRVNLSYPMTKIEYNSIVDQINHLPIKKIFVYV